MPSPLGHSSSTSPARAGRSGLFLAGDIGGTKTLLAVYSPERGPRDTLLQAEFRSARYASLETVVREFLSGADLAVERATFAVAGPVLAGRSQVTNLSWTLEEAALSEELELESVHLVNDLEAIAAALPSLESDELHPINHGQPVEGGAVAVIAPGTGLGEAFLIWDGARYRAFPSEGGHADFAPRNELQAGLLFHLLQRHQHVSVERICSGPGLLNIYRYLRDSGPIPESTELARALAAAEDQPRVIGEAALREDPDPLCRAAVHLLVSILGAEAGNLALKVLSTGGVYLAGGIPQRILPLLQTGGFMQAFTSKGRMSDLLKRMPIQVMTLRAALLGAAMRGLEAAGAYGAEGIPTGAEASSR